MKDDHIKLTVLDRDFEIMRAKTPAGMAFWATSGPKGKTCRQCVHYRFSGYTSKRGSKGGTLKKGPCNKYIEQTGIETNKIPYDTPSCKEFAQADNPPTITQRNDQ